MNPERNIPRGVESREVKSSQVEVQDIFEYTQESYENMSSLAIENILNRTKEDKRFEKKIRIDFDIPYEIPLREGLNEQAEKSISNYKEKLDEKRKSFQEQAEYSFSLGKEKGYLKEIEDYKIVITDKFLNYGIKNNDDIGRMFSNRFDSNTRSAFIEINGSNKLLAHEIGHAYSSDKSKERSGYSRLVETSEGRLKSLGNKWFNEGVTVMWEDISVNDGSESHSDKKYDTYGLYRDVTQLIIGEADLDEDKVLKGYFGDLESRDLVVNKIEKHFNCSIDDLECLLIETDREFLRKIVQGEKIEFSLKENKNLWAINKSEIMKVEELFPNFTIIENEKL